MRCSSELKLGTYHLPRYPVPEGSSLEQLLESEAERGCWSVFQREHYRTQTLSDETLYELKVIKFAGYFLIVMEFIAWSRSGKFQLVQIQGSVGFSSAYALKITNLDPIRYGLLFERF